MFPEQLRKRLKVLRVGTTGSGVGGSGMTPFQSRHAMLFGETISGDHFTASGATVWQHTKVWLNGILLDTADRTLNIDGTVTLAEAISHPDGGILMVETFESV